MAIQTPAQIKIRRGTDADRKKIVLAESELAYTVDTKRVFAGDGTLSGGLPVSPQIYLSGSNPSTALRGDIYIKTGSNNLTYVLTGSNANLNESYTLISDLTSLNAVYTTVSANSANWQKQGTVLGEISYNTLTANSGFWKTAYNSLPILNATVNRYINAVNTVNVLSGNWNNTYATVASNSADWSDWTSSAEVVEYVSPLTATGKFIKIQKDGKTYGIQLWATPNI